MAERERHHDVPGDDRDDRESSAEASIGSALGAVERGRWWPEGAPEGRGLRTVSGAMTATAFATVAAMVECLHRADRRKAEDSVTDRGERTSDNG